MDAVTLTLIAAVAAVVVAVVFGVAAVRLALPGYRLARLQLDDRDRAGLPMAVRVHPVLRVYAGALMVIAGIAGFIEAHSHVPAAEIPGQAPSSSPRLRAAEESAGIQLSPAIPAKGWSQSTYDLVHIAAWALIVLGAVTVVLGIVRAARSD